MMRKKDKKPYWVCGTCRQTAWDTRAEALRCCEYGTALPPSSPRSHSP